MRLHDWGTRRIDTISIMGHPPNADISKIEIWGTRFGMCTVPRRAIFCALSFRMTLNLFGERSRPKINEVFTPRRTEVNREIYVDRLDLEKSLIRALNGSLHAIIFGESGSGKSWLYKKVLSDISAKVATANCANASRLGSLTEEIKQVVAGEEPRKLSEQTEEMNAAVKAVVAEGGLRSSEVSLLRARSFFGLCSHS